MKVYNFEVEEYHTYYVGAAEVLVHNDNCGRGTGNADGSSKESAQSSKSDFVVAPRGTVMDTSKDYNLVSTTTLINQGGEFIQIHNSHLHRGNMPHTHKQQVNTNPVTGVSSSKRVDNFTTVTDIDYTDSVLKEGTLRIRVNKDDVGGY